MLKFAIRSAGTLNVRARRGRGRGRRMMPPTHKCVTYDMLVILVSVMWE